MIIGAFLALFFIWVALASFVSAINNGGTYFIWWGAVLLGAYIFYKGMRQFSEGNNSVVVKEEAQPKQAIIITAPFSGAVVPQKPNTFCEYCGASIEPSAKYCKQCERTQP